MKKLLLGSALFMASASVALAADLPVKAPAQVYSPASAYNWSGFYGGISGGYAWGENKLSDSSFGGATGKTKPRGGFGGAQLGYNNHFAPHWLIGGELDVSGGDFEGKTSVFNGNITLPVKNRFDFFGTARARFGYVQDRTLLYVTGGAIWLRSKLNASGFGGDTQDSAQYHVGWVFGGGVEYAVDDRWSWKLEYLYAPFDRSHDDLIIRYSSWKPSLSIVRAGLNYRFAGSGAPADYMPVKAAVPQADWSGGYLGVHGGYGWGKLHEAIPSGSGASFVDNASFKPDGGYGGFQGGYNWLFSSNALLGIEVDSSFGNLKGESRFKTWRLPAGAPAGAPATGKIENLSTARLRLGYLVTPDTLLYATGGAAYALEKVKASDLYLNSKFDHLGWTIGGGAEWKFAPEWSVKAEYLYANLGKFKNDGPILFWKRGSDLTLNTVRVGINYSGPVIERLFGAH